MRSSFGVLACGLGALAACGDDLGPDRSGTIAIAAQHTRVLARLDPAGGWTILDRDAAGSARLDADGPFTLLSVCEGAARVHVLAAGPEDGDAWDLGCPRPAGTGVIVTVRDTSASPGGVTASLGPTGKALRGGSSVDFEVAPGTYDVALTDPTSHRVVLRRGVVIDGATTIDLDMTQGVALVAHPIASTPAATSLTSTVVTAGQTRIRLGTETGMVTTAWSLPPGLAVAGDVHRALVGSSDTTRRTRARSVPLDPSVTEPIAVTLPTETVAGELSLTPVPSATFTAGGEWTRVELTAYQNEVELTPHWFLAQHPGAGAAPGAIRFPDPTGIAGWDPAWRIDPDLGWWMTLALVRDTADGGSESIGTYSFSDDP